MSAVISQFKKKVKYVQSVEPTNPQVGDSWFDTSTNNLRIYTGLSWSSIWVKDSGIPYGFSMGGNNAIIGVSIVDRFDFPFDTGNASQTGSLSSARNDGGNTCNSEMHGFFFGGFITATLDYVSTIDRLDFPFHLSTGMVRGVLTQEKSAMGSCNSSTYGYIFGGWNKATGSATNRMERISFPFDTGNSIQRGNLAASTFEPGGCNSSTYGYIMGANTTGTNPYQEIGRFQFPFDAGGPSSVGLFDAAITTGSGLNSSTAGYLVAIRRSASPSNVVYKLTFPWTSGTASTYANLANSRENGAACNSTIYGYVMGGTISGNALKTMERFEFAADTSISSRGELSSSRRANVGLDGTDFVGMFV